MASWISSSYSSGCIGSSTPLIRVSGAFSRWMRSRASKRSDGDQVVVLGDWSYFSVAFHQVRAQVRLDEQQHVIHAVQPFLHRLPALGGIEAELQAARGPLLGAHGHGHQQQTIHLVWPGQCVIQGHAGAEGEARQYQAACVPLSMQPIPQPLGVAGHVLKGLALRVAGQVRGQRIREALQLVAVGRRTSARSGAVNQH